MKNLIKLAVSVSLVCGCAAETTWTDGGAIGRRADEAASVEPKKSEAPAPTVVPAPAPAKKTAKKTEIDLDTKLSVKRLVIAHSVKDREPVEASERFVAGEDEKIYAFVEVGNSESVDTAIFVSFIPEQGIERGPIELSVGPAPRWRTWAFTRTATKPGVWHAVVRNARGEEIGRTRFEITAADAKPIDPA
jgi:hypothetical protein